MRYQQSTTVVALLLGTSSAVQIHNNFLEGGDEIHKQSLTDLQESKAVRAKIDRLEELEAQIESNPESVMQQPVMKAPVPKVQAPAAAVQVTSGATRLGSSGINSQVLEFLEPLETIETTTVIPENLGFVQLEGVDGVKRPSDAGARLSPNLKEAAPIWKEMNRDIVNSNIFRRAIHPPKDTYEPYNPIDPEEEAKDFEDRPVAAGFKPEKPTTPTFNVYDVQHRGFQHGIKSNHYDDDFHPDYATGFGGAESQGKAIRGANTLTSREEAVKDQVKAEQKQLEKKDSAAKDAAIAATAGVPEAEKAPGARKVEAKADIKEPEIAKQEEKKPEPSVLSKQSEKKDALFQRYSLAQGLPEAPPKSKDGVARPNDASGQRNWALEHVAPLWWEMNRDIMGSNAHKRAWAAPKDTYEAYSPPDAEAEAQPFEDRPFAASWKKKDPEEIGPPMEPGIKEAIEAMHKHEKENEDKDRNSKLEAIDEVNKDDADVYEKRVEIVKAKHEKKAERRAAATAKGKVLPPDTDSSDDDDLVHPVKAGETVMDKIAPKPKEQKAASLAQTGFLVETPRKKAPVTKASAAAPVAAKAEAKPAVAQTAAKSTSKDAEDDKKEVEKEAKQATLSDAWKASQYEQQKDNQAASDSSKLAREAALAKMTGEEKEAFLKKEEEVMKKIHDEEKPHNGLWVKDTHHVDCSMDVNSKSPLASCRSNKPPKDNYQPYVGAAENKEDKVEKVADTREVTHSRVRNIYQEELDEVNKLVKEEREKEHEDQKAAFAKKRATLRTEEEKEDFDKLIEEHWEHEAELKKKADRGLISHAAHGFECEAVENAANPLGGCRNKHPPHDYHFQPYVGAAETKKVEKFEDTREVTKSRVRNIYQEQLDEVNKLVKEERELEEKQEQEAFAKKRATFKTEEEKQDFDKLIAEHEEHEAELKKKADRGLITHSNHGFECEAVENAANPLGGCRNKHPPHDYHFQPYTGAAEQKDEKVADTREVTHSRVRNIYKEQLEEVERLVKEEEEKEEKEEQAANAKKRATFHTEEEKQDFDKLIAEHEAHEAEMKKKADAGLIVHSKHAFECEAVENAANPLGGCRNKHPPHDYHFRPYVGAAQEAAKPADTREVTKSRVRNVYEEQLKEVRRLQKEEEEKEEREEKAANAKKRATFRTEEEKQDFDKLVAEHEEHEAKMKKEADAGLIVHASHGFECEQDVNAKNPLAGCRNKHPPHDYHFQAYAGAAEQPKKEEDTREWKGSHLVDEAAKIEAARHAKVVEQEKELEKEEAEMFKNMDPAAIKDYKNGHHHHKDRGPLWVEPRGHECEVEVNAKSPLASCRGGKPKESTYEPYDVTNPGTPNLALQEKKTWSIPKPGTTTPDVGTTDFPAFNTTAQAELNLVQYNSEYGLWMMMKSLI